MHAHVAANTLLLSPLILPCVYIQSSQEGLKPPVLIFVQSKARAKELFHELVYDGINVDVIHADRTKQQRDDVVRQFRSGRVWVLIATDLMARGVVRMFPSVNYMCLMPAVTLGAS